MKTNSKNYVMGKHGHDWCHICKERTESNVDIFYDLNKGEQGEYVRICGACLDRMKDILES
jgi:hypothetical protein